jgi:glutaminase
MKVQSSGTIGVSSVNSNVMGNQVEVTFTMQATTGMYCNAGTLIAGLPFKPQTGGGIVAVTDGTSDTAIGLGYVGARGIFLPAIASSSAPTSHAICVTARYFIA